MAKKWCLKMDCDLQEMVASVSKLAQREIPKYQNERFFNTVPREIFGAFAELGLTGISVPEEYGGLGLDMSTCAAIAEEIAAVDLGPAIFLSVHNMVCGIISRLGTLAQKQQLLPPLARGEHLGAFALTEPSAGSDAARLKTIAEIIGNPRSPSSYRIKGDKCYITSAGFADIYIVFARTKPFEEGSPSNGISTFVVNTPGGKPPPGMVIHKPEKKMGCELSPIASLVFDELSLAPDTLLGELHQGYKAAMTGLAGGRVNIAACANGISRTALHHAVEHLKHREQFGQKLIEFQGLQFMLADMSMKLEASRLLTREAAHALDGQMPESRRLTSMAKCFATDAAMSITTDAVQLLGGAGYVREYKVEKLMRDAKMLQIVEGTNQIQRVLIARHLLGGA